MNRLLLLLPLALVQAPVQGQQAQPNAEPQVPSELPNAEDGSDAALAEIAAFIEGLSIDRSDPGWRGSLPRPPQLSFTPGTQYLWNLRTTEGNLQIRLRPDFAPMHVASTIYLTRLGFYDGLGFHRVEPRFVIQGGCPIGNGTGGPGYGLDPEIHPDFGHDSENVVSAVNGGPGTDGSQFFITLNPTPHLDSTHTPFGQVVGGRFVLPLIEKQFLGEEPPSEMPRILEATISLNVFAPLPEADASEDPALATIDQFLASANIDKTQDGWRMKLPKPPLLTFDPQKRYYWNLQTRGGNLKILLSPEHAPMHVSSVIYLTRAGFYDSLIFHRIVTGFLVQAGCPLNQGGGGPGYTLDLEVTKEFSHGRRGVVSSAAVGSFGEGSQFFITLDAAGHLDLQHSAFGRLVQGYEVLDLIGSLGRYSGRIQGMPVSIERATISFE